MAVVEVMIPKMGMATEEVDLTKWLVAVGDRVEPGTPLCEVESEKTTIAIEAEQAGVVAQILVEADTPTAVGKVICRIDTGT
jgi:pyruvate/2-oxoglutarate dehydrogenase complex dihydrolipoamide acyltransferase (E2) component